MKITMIGSGYVGLVSGACFADFGHQVICVDKAADKIAALQSGKIPIYEPGLAELVARHSENGNLTFTTDLTEAVSEAEVIFIAVGTPSRHGDGHADLSYVYAAAKEFSPHLNGYTVVVTKSTVPVGTGDAVERLIHETNPQARFAVVSNPEFLREGSAIGDFKRPDRVIIGCEDEDAKRVMTNVYRPLSLNKAPIVFMSRRSAELAKYAANAFLALKITFINEIADLCEKAGADVQSISHGIGLDKRIGAKFLNAGPGYGGSCFPKDTLALLKTGQDFEAEQHLVATTVAINDARKRAMGRKILHMLKGSPAGQTVAVLGLTFKPNTDDMRDSPAISIIQTLQDAGVKVRAYDPEGMTEARKVLRDVDYCTDPYAAISGADAVALVTEWDEFRALDLARVRTLLTTPIFVDLRNVYTFHEMDAAALIYQCVGKGAVAPQ